MLTFIIDADLPRSTRISIENAGYEAIDVRDVGLGSASDEEIFSFAQREKATILTKDKGFGNIWRFSLGSHQGIIVV